MIKQAVKKIINHAGIDVIPLNNRNDLAQYIKLFGKESVEKRRFYDISVRGHFKFGGGFSHPCWTTIDYFIPSKSKPSLNPEYEINYDLFSNLPLPVDSNSAELVHSQFTIEHITDEISLNFFKDVHRILKQKGVFRIVAPNTELDYIAYRTNDKNYFYWIENFSKPSIYKHLQFKIPLNEASLEQIFLVHFAANASVIHKNGSDNQITDEEFKGIIKSNPMEVALDICTKRCSVQKQKIYRQNHINWWTNQKLVTMLSAAGFRSSYILSSNQSISPVMRNNYYFDRVWKNISLYVEAVK